MKLRELPTHFTIRAARESTKGLEYTQVSINDKAYIYRKTDLSTNKMSYLTFIRMEDKALGCVVFPSSHDFGFWAFKFKTLDEAREKFMEFSCPGMIESVNC